MRRFLTSTVFTSGVLLFTYAFCHPTTAMTPTEALRISAETGRPILAMATSETCVPCQRLKHNVYNAAALQSQLAECVVLEMHSESHEFQQFSSRFPVAMNGVPVVYFIRPDRGMTYGQSGMLSVPELKAQLTDLLRQTGVTLTDDKSRFARERVEQAKKFLNRNEAALALRYSDQLTRYKSMAAPIREAHTVRTSAVAALRRRLDLIETRITIPASSHGAAYRLAEVFAETASEPDLRERAGDMLVRYQQNEATKIAVQQGMELVKARLHERQRNLRAAVDSYQRMIELDPTSPSSDHARKKTRLLQKYLQREVASTRVTLVFPAFESEHAASGNRIN